MLSAFLHDVKNMSEVTPFHGFKFREIVVSIGSCLLLSFRDRLRENRRVSQETLTVKEKLGIISIVVI